MRCDELVEDRVAVLYGEADAASQRRVEEHAGACAACRDELQALRGVRRKLAAWKLPDTLRPVRPWRRRAWAGWAWPAAAALLVSLGGALVVTGIGVSYGDGELHVSFGRPAAPAAKHVPHGHLAAEIHALRAEIDALRAAQAARAEPAALAFEGASADEVHAWIRASESRQADALRAGLDVMERRRQYDMARIKTGFSYLEGRNGQDMANAMKLVSYVLASHGDAAGPR